MSDLEQWERVRPLGEGGQGEVFLVRTPTRAAARQIAKRQILPKVMSLLNLGRTVGNVGVWGETAFDNDSEAFLNAILEYNRPDIPTALGPDNPAELGALKEFKIPTDNKEEEGRAIGRLESEVQALENIQHPAVFFRLRGCQAVLCFLQ
jgi:hypothetical protein